MFEENENNMTGDTVEGEGTEEVVVAESEAGKNESSETGPVNDSTLGIDEEEKEVVRENDFRNEAPAEENANQTASSEDTPVSTSEDSELNKSIDKRAAQAAKRQLKLQKEAQKEAQKKQEKEAKKPKVLKFIAAAVLFGVIAGGIMILMQKLYDDNGSHKQIARTNTEVFNYGSEDKSTEEEKKEKKSEKKEDKKEDSEEEDTTETEKKSSDAVEITDVSAVVDEVMPSVVSITSTEIVQSANNDFWSYFYGYGNDSGEQYESTGAGSGIIVGENDTELLIVTNEHVVASADSLEVKFVDDESVAATVRGQNEKQDIAVISVKLSDIKSSTIDAIKIATLGDSDKLSVGEGAIAIGNALGYGQSVTTGVISALNRTIKVDSYDRTVIQTDAAISPGNSGGALLNVKGELIGINCAKSVDDYAEGMGYAIPITLVKDLIDDMMTKEVREEVAEADKGYLNIYGKDVTSDLSQMYDIPEGVYVMEVIKDGAAEKAGISKYDVITAVEDEDVSSMQELQDLLAYYKKGEKVSITIQTLDGNEYKEKKVDVTLGGEME